LAAAKNLGYLFSIAEKNNLEKNLLFFCAKKKVAMSISAD